MDGGNEGSQDKSSLKPVSSLRSHFENIIKSKPAPPPPPSPSLAANRGFHSTTDPGSRANVLEIPRSRLSQEDERHGDALQPVGPPGPSIHTAVTPRLRPLSMGPISPQRSPPLVTVNSPSSPSQHLPVLQSPYASAHQSRESLQRHAPSRSGSPSSSNGRNFKTPSRAPTPAPTLDSQQVPSLSATQAAGVTSDPRKSPLSGSPIPANSSAPSVPPPVNRAGKPRAFAKTPIASRRQGSVSLAPVSGGGGEDERISPFSTPPSEPDDGPVLSPPSIPDHSKPRFTSAGPQEYGQIGRLVDRLDTTDSSPQPAARRPRSAHIWTNRLDFANRKDGGPTPGPIDSPGTAMWTGSASLESRSLSPTGRLPNDKPHLPPRRDGGRPTTRDRSPRSRRTPPPPPSQPPMRRSMDVASRPPVRQSMEIPGRASVDIRGFGRTSTSDPAGRFLPPPRRMTAANTTHIPFSSASSHGQIPAARVSADLRRPDVPLMRGSQATESVDESEEDDGELPAAQGATLADYPDSSQTNRRPPRFRKRPHDIPTKYETKLFAICGEYICTSGYITRVWNIMTGELILDLQHGDTVKVTAMAFKPASEVEDEGKRVWLGTNLGDLYELDVHSASIIATRPNAHNRTTVTKIHRSGSEMWTLDEQGSLLIWISGEDGQPSLDLSPENSRIPPGATHVKIVGQQVWVAFGRELMVYQPDVSSRTAKALISKPLQQQLAGEITAATMISSQPDLIYFGHIDGKVSIYNIQDFTCQGVVNVSLYKISCLVGVGDHLWAGFNTGMIYVYDTAVTPWMVKKDWRAHKDTIAGIAVDRTSIWKLDRLQVASLGTDGILKIWDGMLEMDWLESDMQSHDAEFCEFRDLSCLVMTWNAGASKPNHLRHDERDSNFFRDLLRGPKEPPDLVVFGFQELVDLEDKKVTAKNLFKSSKKKDSSEKEHMAKQYRAWKDHLVQELNRHMPSSDPYTLLHTSNLIGLFTCVFVKTALRSRISDVDGAQVKLGMKGRYGNKGALVVRFLIDDSSVCFVNCHLAAGQKNTAHRNNDVAAIMEATALTARYDGQTQLDMYVSGGDGSMILDHEICILNGDLNYRIDAMSRDVVIREIQAGNLQKLLDRDQLLLSRRRNPGFRLRAFQEREIAFPPTYKYDVGSDKYDSSEKKRSPAWCDRILYRGVGRIRQSEYRRHEVRVSDHRPVSGLFRIRVKTIDRRRQVVERGRSEERFEVVRRRIAMDIKTDYLISVLGLSRREAERSLKR